MKTFSGRTLRHGLAVAAVAVLGLTACNSEPSARRVAEDLVKTLTDDPDVQQCMLDVIEELDESEGLDELGNDVNEGDLESQARAREALAQYEADLEACED